MQRISFVLMQKAISSLSRIQLSIILTAVLFFGSGVGSVVWASQSAVSINVMAPLLVGDPKNPEGAQSVEAWRTFQQQLRKLKLQGVQAVSTDIWWGLIEASGPGRFEWNYYQKMAALIRAEGLHWVPILSFHQLGGNVGDVGFMPLPAWVWTRYQEKNHAQPDVFKSAEDLMFLSEQGHFSKEYVSFWATDLVKKDYQRVMESFRDHFANYGDIVDEINVSLGPSGELRYPSYNAHDQHVDYPSRGALQAYSQPAVHSFRAAMLSKYKNIQTLNSVWGFKLADFSDVFPPGPELLRGPFWQNKEEFSNYGKDFFDWYNQTLVEHGQKVLGLADAVFTAKGSRFAGVALGAKVPGIHWRMSSDRLAELAAGLIRTSYSNWNSANESYGYQETLKVFAKKRRMKTVMHFTAIEMNDGRDGVDAASLAKTLVGWIGDSAFKLGIEIKGENALSGELSNSSAWNNMKDAVLNHHYSGVTLLRANEIVGNLDREQSLKRFSDQVSQRRSLKCLGMFR